MSDPIDAWIRDIEERRIPDLRKQLSALDGGSMRLGERRFGSAEWVDTTPREIGRLKAAIVEYEAILAKYRARQTVEAR